MNTVISKLALRLGLMAVLAVAALLPAPAAVALLDFDAGFAASSWQAGGDRQACRLQHPIPEFGQATFVREAGMPLRLELDTTRVLAAPGDMAVAARQAVWREQGLPEHLGIAAWTGKQMAVPAPLATRLLLELRKGRIPQFSANADTGGAMRVALSAANFQPAYRSWLACLPELLPWSFGQVERTAVYFDTAKSNLDADDRAALDRVVQYCAADQEVQAVYVDGHTDELGSDEANVTLAQARADAVYKYLLAAGVPETRVRLRYHGERYPAADNSSSDGRARNRRTTVRLDRTAPPPPLPEQPADAVEMADAGPPP